ncbi:MAG: hypothetical protein Q9226_007632 [Calogaya cf. arnoldii]
MNIDHFGEDKKRRGFVLDQSTGSRQTSIADAGRTRPAVPDSIPIHVDMLLDASIIAQTSSVFWTIGGHGAVTLNRLDPNTYGWALIEGFPEREVATILAGNKNVALMLVEASYASNSAILQSILVPTIKEKLVLPQPLLAQINSSSNTRLQHADAERKGAHPEDHKRLSTFVENTLGPDGKSHKKKACGIPRPLIPYEMDTVQVAAIGPMENLVWEDLEERTNNKRVPTLPKD